MPIVLDLLHSGAWVRSLLPVLNRLGQSVPPLLLADRVRRMPRKRWGLVVCSGIMAASFLALSVAWMMQARIPVGGLRLFFLFAYAVFFVSTGVNQICFNTLQGKLVRVTHRGRLMLVANVVGATCAVGLALALLPGWLAEGAARFAWIFGFSGGCFFLATALCLLLVEPRDAYCREESSGWRSLGLAWRTVRDDRTFRRLALIAGMFGVSLVLFPHYQALGRGERLGISLREDRRLDRRPESGHGPVQFRGRAAGGLAWQPHGPPLDPVRPGLGALAGDPLVLAGAVGGRAFPAVFLLVGLTPVILRILHNYTLELVRSEDHPRYLATINLCIAVPVLFSPLAGWSLAWIGFDVLFCGVAAMILLAWLLTFGLYEPRHASASDTPPPE